jgi:phage tail-like protein
MRPDDPFVGYLFRLSLGNVQIAGFAECTGLELETKVFEYREGGRNSHVLKLPEQSEVKNLVLKRGLTLSDELYDWYMDIASGTFAHANRRGASGQDSSRKISIAVVDSAGSVRKEWLLRRAFPVKWVGPELKATDNALCFESLELAHEGLEKQAV